MIIILTIGLMVTFGVIYKLLGSDIFAPACVITLSYILATLCACVNIEYWQIDISPRTVFFIGSGIFMSVAGNIIVYIIFQKKYFSIIRKSDRLIVLPYFNIPLTNVIFIAVYDCLAIFLYYLEVRKIGGKGSFTTMMYSFRQNIMYSGYSVSVFTNQLIRLVTASAIVCIYFFIYNVIIGQTKIKTNLYLLIPVILDFIKCFLTSGRYEFLELFLEGVMLYALFYFMKNKKVLNINIKFIWYGIIGVIGLLVFFCCIREAVGRSSNQTIIDYVSSYFGGSIELFDLYVKEYKGATSVHFGTVTFTSIYKYLNKFIGTSIDLNTINEFRRSSNGILIGNVYTTFRYYLQDFGYIGLVLLSFLSSIVYSVLYYKALIKKSHIRKIIYSYLFYTIVLHSYSEQFFSVYLSIDIWMIMFLVGLVYFYFNKVKIRIKINKRI